MRRERETLRGLIERVERAAGPDNQLDEDIEGVLGWPHALWTSEARPFTSSLDAARSIAPYAIWTLGFHEDPATGKILWTSLVGPLHEHQSVAATPALALTAALLRERLADLEGDATDDATENC